MYIYVGFDKDKFLQGKMINPHENVEIIYKDDYLMAVVKPYGMIVNNADTSRNEYTLQDWVKNKMKDDGLEMKDDGSDFENRNGIVHRLDKETSGILLIAKDEESFLALQSQFKNRLVEKTYVALCHGKFPEEANISVPIGRLPWNRTRFGVVPDGRTAITDFRRLSVYIDPDDKYQTISLVEAFPKTGRTHQIRVHLQYAGFPIYSDALYGGRKISARDRKRLPRHFLHAQKIKFIHPHTKDEMILESNLPKDLDSFLKSLVLSD